MLECGLKARDRNRYLRMMVCDKKIPGARLLKLGHTLTGYSYTDLHVSLAAEEEAKGTQTVTPTPL